MLCNFTLKRYPNASYLQRLDVKVTSILVYLHLATDKRLLENVHALAYDWFLVPDRAINIL